MIQRYGCYLMKGFQFWRETLSQTITVVVPLILVTSAAWSSSLPRVGDGHPDLGGVWYYGSATPLERPVELGTRQNYSNVEAQSIIAKLKNDDAKRFAPSDPDRAPPEKVSEVGQEADDNFVITRTNLTQIAGRYRTSLIIDPSNGRLPFRKNAQDIFDRWSAQGMNLFDGPELRPASERCLSVVGPIAPVVGWYYNANMRIVQTMDHIMIKGEMLKPRIIALNNGMPTQGFNLWMGESTAHWKQDILVIKTVNFRPENSWFRFKSSDKLQIGEYFKLIARDEILYRYTVSDSKIYSEPFTVEMNIKRRPPGEHLYEFACHEANYSLPHILRGARLGELE